MLKCHKYIVYNSKGNEEIVVFDSTIQHDVMSARMLLKIEQIKAAGMLFVSSQGIGDSDGVVKTDMWCAGESLTLGVVSRGTVDLLIFLKG